MDNQAKQPTNKNEQKKKKAIIISSAAVVVVVALVGIIIGVITNSAKSYDEVGKILDKTGYSTYYYFDRNYYDKDGKCYKYDYSETTTCDREVGINDVNFFKIEALGEAFQIESYYGFDENGEAKNRIISVEKEVNDDDSLSYSFDDNGEIISLFYYKSDGENCYSLYNDSNVDEVNFCDESDNKMLIRFQKDVESALKGMGVTSKDIANYFDGYLEWYVMPKYEAAKKDIEAGLSYEKAKEYIEDAGYTIEADDESVTLLNNRLYSYEAIGYYPGVNRLGYINSSYDGYYLFYLIEEGYYLGTSENSSCLYYIEFLDESSQTGDDSMALGCSENDKDQLDYLHFSFEREVKRMNLTQNELIKFTKEYY